MVAKNLGVNPHLLLEFTTHVFENLAHMCEVSVCMAARWLALSKTCATLHTFSEL
jgi:hypothetical protein